MDMHKTVAERLRAQAELCLRLASASWNEEHAEQLRRMASECLRAAEAEEQRAAMEQATPRTQPDEA